MIWQKDFHIPELWKYFWKIWKILLRIQYLNLINIYSIYSMQYFKKSTSWAARASCHDVLSDIAQDVYRTRLLSDWLWRPVTTWFTEWFMVSKNSEHQYSTLVIGECKVRLAWTVIRYILVSLPHLMGKP